MAEEIPPTVKNLTLNESSSPLKQNDPDTLLLKEKVDEWLKRSYTLTEFPQLLEAINSKDRFKEVYGTIGLRKILSEQNPPIQAVIDANLVPKLISFMQNRNEPHLQLEAAWSLTNVASGTTQQTQTIIDQGGIPCFINLLKSTHQDIAEQGVWAIGNIAGDSASFRDLILKLGGLEPLLSLVNQSTNRVIIKHGTWAISNLCRGKPLPKFEFVKQAIPTLCKIVQNENDVDILTDATWALSYLSHEKPGIAHELAKDLIPVLIKHLDSQFASLSIPCLRTLGNITEDDAEQNIALSHPSYMPKLFQLTCNRGKAVRRETCWLLSNLTAGDSTQIEALIKNPYYVDMLIKMSATDAIEVQREVCYVFSNATKNSTSKQLAYMIELGVMDCLLRLMTSSDAKTVEVAAHGIMNMLNTGSFVSIGDGKKKNEFVEILVGKGGIKKLEDLQNHPSDDIYNVACSILEKHFELESLAEID